MSKKSNLVLVADGYRRIWTTVFDLNGNPYAKIEGKLRPCFYHRTRGVWIALRLSLDPKLARYL